MAFSAFCSRPSIRPATSLRKHVCSIAMKPRTSIGSLRPEACSYGWAWEPAGTRAGLNGYWASYRSSCGSRMPAEIHPTFQRREASRRQGWQLTEYCSNQNTAMEVVVRDPPCKRDRAIQNDSSLRPLLSGIARAYGRSAAVFAAPAASASAAVPPARSSMRPLCQEIANNWF